MSRSLPVILAAGESSSDTISNYMPDVKVEIAFNAGVRTPAADRVWTDVSEYVEFDEGIQIGHGRGDRFSTTDANWAMVTLDNTDGRFTVGLVSGAYYPNVKVGRPIRVSITTVKAATTIRYVGFIDQWPVEWDGTDATAQARIKASSRLARLGGGRKLKSIIEEEVGLDGPEAYYTFGEAAGATSAADSSGNSAESLVMAGSGAAVVFGTATGPSTDGLTAASFAGGKYLKAVAPPTYDAVEFFIVRNGVPAGGERVVVFKGSGTYNSTPISYVTLTISAGVGTEGELTFGTHDSEFGTVGSNDWPSPAITDGGVHHVMAFWDAGTHRMMLRIDGTEYTSEGLDFDFVPAGQVTFGGGTVGSASNLTGSLAHAALHNGVPSLATAARHYEAGLTGFAGETPGERIERYASYAGIPAAEVNADAGTSPMAHIDTTGKSALEAMRIVETTEGGVLFDGRDGTLEFRGRDARYLAVSAFTLDFAAQRIEADYKSMVDRTEIQNDVTASNLDGTVTARAVNQASVDDYDAKGDDLELATTDVNEPLQAAWWMVNTYAEPRSRVPTLTVDLLPIVGNTILAGDVGTRFTTTGAPTQAASATGDYFIEGYTETLGPESYFITFNVSDASVSNVWILDDATYSVLGTTTRLAY